MIRVGITSNNGTKCIGRWIAHCTCSRNTKTKWHFEKKIDENHNNWRHWVEIGKMFVSYSEVFAEYSDNAKSVEREKIALEKFAPMTKPLRAKANHYRNN